jgi:peptidoglycan hydrolase-like protein with peptidoglycan-binding domain
VPMMRRSCCVAAIVAAVALLPASASAARGHAGVAALQVALRATGVYGGDVDGWYGARTRRAVRRFQRRRGLRVDGIAGRRTRRALGRRGRPRLGARAIRPGAAGFDVAALQFLLAWQGFPSGAMGGGHGPRTARALRRFPAAPGSPSTASPGGARSGHSGGVRPGRPCTSPAPCAASRSAIASARAATASTPDWTYPRLTAGTSARPAAAGCASSAGSSATVAP